MAEPHLVNVSVTQENDTGILQGVHIGDNIIINSANQHLSPKQAAEQTHKNVKAEWEVSGTCNWLRQKSEFDTWVKMVNKYCVLWIQGLQGCGKTTLMSRVIEHIRSERVKLQDPRAINLSFFYIPYAHDETEQPYMTMLRTFWEQTIMEDDAQSSYIYGHEASEEKLQDDLISVLAKSQRDVYIVVDALDQLKLNDQDRLLQGLYSLVQKHREANNPFRLAAVISSRDPPSYDLLQAHELLQIHVRPNDNAKDIRKYLEKKLDSRVLRENPKLRRRVLFELMEKADGMFLWAALQRANICDMEFEGDVTDALKTLIPPGKMPELYRKYAIGFETIEQRHKKEVALRTIALLVYTAGSIPKRILLVALTLDMSDGQPHPATYKDLSVEPAKIVRICKHLIDIDEDLGVFRFCHGSVYEFFREYNSAGYYNLITQLCLAHICSSSFTRGPFEDAKWFDYGSLGPFLQEHPFLEFASSNWATSLKRSIGANTGKNIEEIHVQVLDFLENLFSKEGQKNLQLSFQVHFLALDKSMPAGVCYEHILSYFALIELFSIFMKRGWLNLKQRDGMGMTAIHYAIQSETEKNDRKSRVVEELLKYRADVNEKDNGGCTPLYYASDLGNLHVVQLLLRHKAKVNTQNKEGGTALIAACRKHHEEIISKLLESKADVRIQSLLGTALQAACLDGCIRCAEAILRKYGRARIIENKGPLGTSLHVAAFYGRSDVVDLLLSKKYKDKFDVRATNEYYGSVLTAAATGCSTIQETATFYKIFEKLIARGVDLNDPSGQCGPALRAAAWCGHADLVRLLLENGAEVRLANGPMGTAYQAADQANHEEIMRLLLDYDPNAAAYSKDDPINTIPLLTRFRRELFTVALVAGNMKIINYLVGLVERFFEIEITKGKISVLHAMANMGREVFNDVIDGATKTSTKTHASPVAPKAQDISDGAPDSAKPPKATLRHLERCRLWLRRIFSRFSSSKAQLQQEQPSESGFNSGRIEQRFRDVLDRLTRAAVNILEHAIWSGAPQVIQLIADTWVDALQSLISRGSFGEPMLESVVHNRTIELVKYLTKLDLDETTRFKKAEGLARVGVELLITTVRRGQDNNSYKQLAFVLSRLWVDAVDHVEALGERGQQPVWRLIEVFVAKFSDAVKKREKTNATILGDAGVEVLRAAALSRARESRKSVMNKFIKEWVRQWKFLIDAKMEDVAKTLLDLRLEEYKKCAEDGRHEDAFGLAVAGTGLLREAIEQGIPDVESKLLDTVKSGYLWTTEFYQQAPEQAFRNGGGVDIKEVFNALVSLFAPTEKIDSPHFQTLAMMTLDGIEMASSDMRQGLMDQAHQRIQFTRRGNHSEDFQLQLRRICITVLYLLDMELRADADRPNALSVLKAMAQALPNVTKRGKFARFVKANGFLQSQETQDEAEEA